MSHAYMPQAKTVEWETPLDFFKIWDDKYHFTLDVCATPENAKCKRYFTEEQNGLVQSWQGAVCWMNPPYGRAINDWIRKAYHEWKENGVVCVCLLPARTDTGWFHDYVLPYATLYFVRGRLKFGGQQNSATFPSIVAVYE